MTSDGHGSVNYSMLAGGRKNLTGDGGDKETSDDKETSASDSEQALRHRHRHSKHEYKYNLMVMV